MKAWPMEQDPDETTQMLPLARDAEPYTASLPVFVDATGRRRRTTQRIAVGAFLAAGGYSLMVMWSFLGGPVSPDTLMPFSAQHAAPAVQSAQPSSAGTISVAPALSASKSTAAGTVTIPTRSASPSTPASASASTTASPSASATTHRGKPSKSATPGHGA